MKLRLTPFDALIVVDVQRDFMPGGALPVPEGDKVVAPLNQYIERFSKANLPVFSRGTGIQRTIYPLRDTVVSGHPTVYKTRKVPSSIRT
jgi:hypothetical protein